MKKMRIREIGLKQLHRDLLAGFDRTQAVEQVWRVIDGRKEIVPCSFVESWNTKALQEIALVDFRKIIEGGGRVFLAYEGKNLLGFAALKGERLGLKGEYLQLEQMQVSNNQRGRGIGRALFDCCVQIAKVMGAEKLYISAHSSVETQAFYQKMGCVEAEWLFDEQVGREPYDVQMEFVIE